MLNAPRILGRLLVATLFCLGFWQLGHGAYIPAKAWLAQELMQRAWTRTGLGEDRATPWPWADTWPVARLIVPSQHIDQIVLEGAYGRTLAFGPGHVESAQPIGSSDTIILTGHRDTHFSFLKDLQAGDRLLLQSADGTHQRYRVRDRRIAHVARDAIPLLNEGHPLALVTCYPFDSLMPGTAWRYVVIAESEGNQ